MCFAPGAQSASGNLASQRGLRAAPRADLGAEGRSKRQPKLLVRSQLALRFSQTTASRGLRYEHPVTLRDSLKPPLCEKMASWITFIPEALIWDVQRQERETSGLEQLLLHLCGSHIFVRREMRHRGQTHKTSPGLEDSPHGIIF